MRDDGVVYKILIGADAARFRADGGFAGSALDLRDGYIHLSTAAQLRQTLALHYKGASGLTVLGVAVRALPEAALRWEPSRGGQLFPHLYAALPWASVVEELPVDVDADGVSTLPTGFP
jgi:uncharacterized protein (DUF952 family)